MSGGKYRYDEGEYRELLESAKSYYSFIFYDETDSEGPLAIWRHDVDFSLHRALALAAIESSCGVKATYFLHLHSAFYNPLEDGLQYLTAGILEHGHEIGLHFDPAYYGARIKNMEDAERFLDLEKSVIENTFETPVTAFSLHNPTFTGVELAGEQILAGMRNASNTALSQAFVYASDSRGGWKRRDLPLMVRSREHKRLHVLTHPERWTPKPVSVEGMVERSVKGAYKAHRRLGKLFTNLWAGEESDVNDAHAAKAIAQMLHR